MALMLMAWYSTKGTDEADVAKLCKGLVVWNPLYDSDTGGGDGDAAGEPAYLPVVPATTKDETCFFLQGYAGDLWRTRTQRMLPALAVLLRR